MYANISLHSFVMMLLLATLTDGARPGAVEKEINLKLRSILSRDVLSRTAQNISLDPRTVVYPKKMTSLKTSPTFNPISPLTVSPNPQLRPLQPQSPTKRSETNVLSEERAADSEHQMTSSRSPTNAGRNLIQGQQTTFQPQSVIRQPAVSFQFNYPSYVLRSHLVPVQTPSTTTIVPRVAVSGFSTRYAFIYGPGSRGTPTAFSVDLFKPKDFLGGEGTDGGSKRTDHYDYNDVFSDDGEDEADKTRVKRSIRKDYVPKPPFRNVKIKASPNLERRNNLSSGGYSISNWDKAGDKRSVLTQAAQPEFSSSKNAIKERKSNNEDEIFGEVDESDFDDFSQASKEHDFLPAHLIDFEDNEFPNSQEDFNKIQVSKEDIVEHEKDRMSTDQNRDHVTGFLGDIDSYMKVFPGLKKEPERGINKPAHSDGLNESQGSKNKFVRDDTSWMRSPLIHAEPDLTRVFNESISDDLSNEEPHRDVEDVKSMFSPYEKFFDYLSRKLASNSEMQKDSKAIAQSTRNAVIPTATTDEQSMIRFKNLGKALVQKEANEDDDINMRDYQHRRGIKRNKNTFSNGMNTEINNQEVDDIPSTIQSLPSGSTGVEVKVPYDVTFSEEQSKNPNPLCKEVHDIGLSQNGMRNETELSHVRNLVCVNDYDGDDDRDVDRSDSNEYDESREMTAEYERSKELSAENNESMDFD